MKGNEWSDIRGCGRIGGGAGGVMAWAWWLMSEHDEQAALFAWAAWQGIEWPELRLLFAIGNGGHRHKAVAAKMKAEGVKAGVWDVFLPVMRRWKYGSYGIAGGLWIEMKHGKNKLTDNQVEFGDLLDVYGDYRKEVCYSAKEAVFVICDYLGREVPPEWEV